MANALASHWRLKAALSVALTLAFCLPYFALQHVVLFPVRYLRLSALDRAIEFNPHWIWVYQSVYLLVSVVPWLADSALDLQRYARGFLLQAYVGFAVFLFFPIAGPRPSNASGDPMFQFLLTYDSPLNSLPSLHVGLAVYTVLVAGRLSNGRLSPGPRAGAIAFASIWCAAIAYSAIATKQHYVIDLPAGAVLALLCYQWSWSQQPLRRLFTISRTLPNRDRDKAGTDDLQDSSARPSGAHTTPFIDRIGRSAHVEAPGARVPAGRLSPERSHVRIADAAGQSAGRSGSSIAARVENRVRTGGA